MQLASRECRKKADYHPVNFFDYIHEEFTDLHSLECLSGLKQLEVLCLSGNPFVKEKEDEEQISKDVKSILPQLTKLNL